MKSCIFLRSCELIVISPKIITWRCPNLYLGCDPETALCTGILMTQLAGGRNTNPICLQPEKFVAELGWRSGGLSSKGEGGTLCDLNYFLPSHNYSPPPPNAASSPLTNPDPLAHLEHCALHMVTILDLRRSQVSSVFFSILYYAPGIPVARSKVRVKFTPQVVFVCVHTCGLCLQDQIQWACRLQQERDCKGWKRITAESALVKELKLTDATTLCAPRGWEWREVIAKV